MNPTKVEELAAKRCKACEGGVEKLTPAEAQAQLQKVDGWRLTHDGERIEKSWRAIDFQAAMDFLARVGQLAEQEAHHPELHLERYRHVRIEIWTHAIGGLSESDFILAAKIDQVPIESKGHQ